MSVDPGITVRVRVRIRGRVRGRVSYSMVLQ